MPESKYPSREFIKRLVNTDQWDHLGMIFHFTPRMTTFHGRSYFDWTSAPPDMMQIMFPRNLPEPRPPMISVSKQKTALEHLWEKQNGICFYCGLSALGKLWTRDHVVPRSRGGRHVVGACGPCNHAKGNMTLEEFIQTDYLPEDRRTALGAVGPPVKSFKEAKDEHQLRCLKINC